MLLSLREGAFRGCRFRSASRRSGPARCPSRRAGRTVTEAGPGDRPMDVRSSSHPTDQTLKLFNLGLLDDGSAETVNAHLRECPDCKKRVAGMSSDSALDRVRDAHKGANQSQVGRATADGPRKAAAPPQ